MYYVCLWEDADYHGDRYEWYAPTAIDVDIDWWNGDNEISSVKNYSTYDLCLYDNDNFTGDRVRIPAQKTSTNLGDFNDQAESFKTKLGSC